ncbi:hypothetical protein ACQP1O_16995 [Nocardia sp. CA-151230]|uniref:hypothetical protein n=1 Tax=Nocardia sp. CA-151230 TaxID=3239982 RepID=UPI003D91DCFC
MDMDRAVTMSMPSTMTMRLPSRAGHRDLAIGLGYLAVAAVWVAHSYRRASVDDHAHRLTGAMQAVMAGATAVMFRYLSYTG